MGLLVSTACAMDENAVVGNAPAGQHLMGQMQNPQMTSWEELDNLMGVDIARARTLVVNKVDAELAGPTGVSWEGITHLIGVDIARARTLVVNKVNEEEAGPTGVSLEGINHLMGVDMPRANALLAARAAAEIH